jgi:hypothetical protein
MEEPTDETTAEPFSAIRARFLQFLQGTIITELME